MTTHARPLATFILFAYNQERFVREAIAAALAQDYEPLEIILSDDCSSDRTFDFMQEMAAGYRGPHSVRAARTSRNLGVTQHVLGRGREARGEIVVVAAGDDISKPHRTSRIVQALGDDPAVMAVTTGFDLIDESGSQLRSGVELSDFLGGRYTPHYIRAARHPFVRIQGSTAGYRRAVFELPFPENAAGWEDQLLNFAIYANGGRVAVLDESLVLYRQHDAAIVNRAGGRSRADPEQTTIVQARMQVGKLETFLWVTRNCSDPGVVNLARIEDDLARWRVIAAWPDLSPGRRLVMLLRSLLAARRTLFIWQSTRIFGRFPNYQPQSWLDRRRRRSTPA